ncbi:MAG: hypothetical protein ACQCXQ_10130 [Verrucomicrobiales bacterium]|nr:hypothetical protein [Verrucomicrobiota bacterium JB025]
MKLFLSELRDCDFTSPVTPATKAKIPIPTGTSWKIGGPTEPTDPAILKQIIAKITETTSPATPVGPDELDELPGAGCDACHSRSTRSISFWIRITSRLSPICPVVSAMREISSVKTAESVRLTSNWQLQN